MTRTLKLLLLPLLFMPLITDAATWYVDASVASSGDGTTWETAFISIQEGIDASSGGDALIVAQGTYVENVEFKGKNVTLRSVDPLDANVVANTMIDGGHAGPTVSFLGTEDETCVLSGFTITNGRNPQNGGGIYGGYPGRSRARIENNVITRNFAGRSGGGISSCNGVIRNNRIERNEAMAAGGGIYWCGGVVDCNEIVLNVAGYGGGAFACDGSIGGCIFAANHADVRGGAFEDCHGTIHDNLITGNCGESGGGIGKCHGILQNNTIVGNKASFGGGLLGCEGTIINCIVWANSATEGPQLFNCNPPRYSCVQDWQSGGTGNIADDPALVDMDGPDDDLTTWEDNDLRLSAGSPCVDAGVNYYWTGWPVRDAAGNCRLAHAVVDIGCYEFGFSSDTDGDLIPDLQEPAHGSRPNSLDTDGDGLPDGIELIRGTDPADPDLPGILTVPKKFLSIQQAIQVSLEGEELLIQPGTYIENIHFLGKNIVLRGSNPADWATVERTVVDGGRSGSVVSFLGTEADACLLSGLTIRNGYAREGGGIFGGLDRTDTRVRIQTNLISGNEAHAGGGLFGCHGLIHGNVISRNSAAAGAGLWLCDGIIRGNLFAENLADDVGGGLGLCDGEIVGNIISGNTATQSGGGGLVSCQGLIANNLIIGNWGHWGGGLSGCWGRVTNNIIHGNVSDRYGGGLQGCVGEIVNCIIWNNEAPEGPQLHGSAVPTYSCIQDWTGGGEGNISEDPRFLGAENGDFRLRTDSPCIDAGLNSPDLPEFDIAGMHRVMFGGKSLTVDMGAYEFYINKLEPVPGTDEAVFTWSSLADKSYSIFYTDDQYCPVVRLGSSRKIL